MNFKIDPTIEDHSFRPIQTKQKLDTIENKLFTFIISITSPGKYIWHITRSFEEFEELNQNLSRAQLKGNLGYFEPFPHPNQLKSVQSEEQLRILSRYLQSLSSNPEISSLPEYLEFIEVSALSFKDTDRKRKEGYVNKRTGGRVGNEQRCFNCTKHCKRLQKRWLIVRENMVGYLTNHTKTSLHEVLIFKGKFEVLKGTQDTGYPDGILIITQNRKFYFRAGSQFKMEEWYKEIQDAKGISEWADEEFRYNSSFPMRYCNKVNWFVDGLNYFNEVYDSLLAAKREVFISDWWLSPELFLKRPSIRFPGSQVVEVLGNLADRGVAVYVHVYKEVSFALTLNSLHTEKTLKNRHENIKVIRHPHRSVAGGEFLWSHHEKIICIDQEIAFIGGLDLCFGRMDTSEHRLSDEESPFFWNGIDYSNVRIADFSNVENYTADSLDRHEQPRMPWHDVGIKAVGKVASDVALHFIELWNHVMTDITSNYHKNKIILEPTGGHPLCIESDDVNLSRSSALNLTRRSMSQVNSKNKVKRGDTEASGRIHIEDLVLKVEEASPKKYDENKAIHIEQAPERVRREFRNASVQMDSDTNSLDSNKGLIGRRSMTQPRDWQSRLKREKLETEEETKMKVALEADLEEGDEAFNKNLLMPNLKDPGERGKCDCQVIRSASTWSLGVDETESSIYDAYLHLIDESNHFIYIENQFFVSGTAGSLVKNQIAEAIVRRIKIAAAEKEKFKVIVVLPLLPGFTGAIDDNSASVLRVQLHWLYETISKGRTSVFNKLYEDANVSHPLDYIQFYGLRTHGVINEKPVTEIVYVHSKLMIIDDTTVLVGSANINDRSLLGYHDSEIAMVVNDNEKIMSVLGGNNVTVSKFAFTLRTNIFKEILGTSDESILKDPLSPEFENYLKSTASNNTEIFKEIFRCIPDNDVKHLREIETFQQESNLHEYSRKKNEIRGFIVDFPLEFLCFEDLRLKIFSKEYYIPDESFV
jgi:phospholipase D1/2